VTAKFRGQNTGDGEMNGIHTVAAVLGVILQARETSSSTRLLFAASVLSLVANNVLLDLVMPESQHKRRS
jgi:hypothetical protein